MKLYLSSFNLGNNPERLYKLFSDNRKVVVIMNAQDYLNYFIFFLIL